MVIKPTRILPWSLIAVLVALTGCGDTDTPPPALASPHPSVSSSSADVPLSALPVAPDPLTADDPLSGASPDPLAANPDPLANTKDPLASTTKQEKQQKYSDHFHWLHGSISSAKVTVRLNGVFLGDYSEAVDEDITMKLHDGINTVTFVYQPADASALVDLNVLESEHNPPIPPLATFKAAGMLPGGSGSVKIQTLTFYSRDRFTGN